VHQVEAANALPPHGPPPTVAAGAATPIGATLRFPRGLPGFPGARLFRLEQLGPGAGNRLLLQSAETPELRFIVLAAEPGHSPVASDDLAEALAELDCPADQALMLLVLTMVPGGDGIAASVNLRAPIVVDCRQRTALQHVLRNPIYPLRQPLGPLPAAAG
jgi:flagellar assembly factor FliW